MSSNRADSTAAARPRVWSVQRRFTLLYAGSTAVLLLLAVGFLDWALERSLDARDHALVVSKAQVLQLLLREQPDATEVLASELSHEAAGGPLHYFLRIIDEQGRVWMETPGMGETLPAGLFPPPAPDLPKPPYRAPLHTDHHGPFRLLSVRAAVGAPPREHRVVQVALDATPDLALLAGYRTQLLMVLGVGLVFATVVGAWLAKQGTKPLWDITAGARQITASHLQTRLVVADWPLELADLGTAFNGMLDRLEESMTRLSQSAGELAHELRTPISNLRGEAEVALARCRTPAEYRTVLESSLEEYERLARMIDGLLFIARADNPRAVVDRSSLRVRLELEAVRDFYDALAAEHGVEVVCDGEATLRADPLLLRRAVGNLLANALRHTPRGGQVRLATRTSDDGTVEVEVRDNGHGIASDDLPRVFERFYRAGEPGTSAERGTGLGLPIVRSIMRLHGGTAEIQSRLQEGTVVTLRFPAGSAPPSGQITEM